MQLLPLGVFRASLDGRLLAANPAFLELAGLDPAGPLPDLDLSEVLADESDQGHMEAPAEGGTRYRPRVDLRQPGGDVRRVSVTEVLGSDEAGRPVLDGLVEDLEREGAGMGERLDVARRFETIGRLSGPIAHDVNNLITAIMGYASLLDRGLPPGDDRRRDVAGILEASERCRNLVRQLLDAGRRGDGEPRLIHVGELLTRMRGLLERLVSGRGRLALAETPHADCWVLVDPVQLEQVLLNLVANARDALGRQGTIRVSVRHEQLLERDGPLRPGWHVVLTVADDGSGMEPAVADQVFDPFFTTKRAGAGTGLGLSSVRSILERWGGDVRLATASGIGTRFELWLRRREAPS